MDRYWCLYIGPFHGPYPFLGQSFHSSVLVLNPFQRSCPVYKITNRHVESYRLVGCPLSFRCQIFDGVFSTNFIDAEAGAFAPVSRSRSLPRHGTREFRGGSPKQSTCKRLERRKRRYCRLHVSKGRFNGVFSRRWPAPPVVRNRPPPRTCCTDRPPQSNKFRRAPRRAADVGAGTMDRARERASAFFEI